MVHRDFDLAGGRARSLKVDTPFTLLVARSALIIIMYCKNVDVI